MVCKYTGRLPVGEGATWHLRHSPSPPRVLLQGQVALETPLGCTCFNTKYIKLVYVCYIVNSVLVSISIKDVVHNTRNNIFGIRFDLYSRTLEKLVHIKVFGVLTTVVF